MAANDASGPNLSKKARLLTGTAAAGGGRLENSLAGEGSAKKWSSMDAPDQTLEHDFKEILKGSSMQLLQAFHARLNICTNLRKELAVASKARKEAEDQLRAEREARQKEQAVASKAGKEAEDLLRAEREARQKEREGFLELISSLEKELGKFLEERVGALEESEQSLQEALQSQERALVDLRSSIGTIRKGAGRAGQAYSSFNRLHGKLRELSVANSLGQVPAPQDNISPSLDPNFVVHKREENDHDDNEDSVPICARIRPHKKKA